jgi:hypothetical protein
MIPHHDLDDWDLMTIRPELMIPRVYNRFRRPIHHECGNCVVDFHKFVRTTGTRETKSVPTKNTYESYTVITRTDHNLPPVPSHDGFVTHGRMVYSFCRYRSIYMYMYRCIYQCLSIFLLPCECVFKVLKCSDLLDSDQVVRVPVTLKGCILPVLKYLRFPAPGCRVPVSIQQKKWRAGRERLRTRGTTFLSVACRVDLSFNRRSKKQLN